MSITEETHISRIRSLLKDCGYPVTDAIRRLPASGSGRIYHRLTLGDGSTLIATYGPSCDENRAFLSLSRHFLESGLPVPRILGQSGDLHYYLQEDLGDISLSQGISKGSQTGTFSPQETGYLEKAIRLLPHFQFRRFGEIDLALCYPMPSFGAESIMWDLNYFKYSFLKPMNVDFREDLLERDFQSLCGRMLKECQSRSFMLRDFQSRNVMLLRGEPYFIDYQGGRQGPFLYDVASFLYQASARLKEDLRRRLFLCYMEELGEYLDVDQDRMRESLDWFVLLRILQVLGAYGLRGLFEHKTHFLESIPPCLENLRELTGRMDLGNLPYLRKVLEDVTRLEPFQRTPEPAERLVVEVTSFSYKNGLPEDHSGNGGGYIFDCRALHNPGRYAQYRNLNGRDRSVMDFLENEKAVDVFLHSVFTLVDQSVGKYLERGFRHLQVSFGCTGGQHRSVYSAERLAFHLHERFEVDIRLIHRELGLSEFIASKKATTPQP